MSTVNPTAPVTNSIPAATTSAPSTGNAAVQSAIDGKTIAGNFDTFLQLLTTQLRNQNPLDPLDTNQFTQQLVSFAGVEQQIRQNQQLETLITFQRSAQATTALQFVGATVAVDGQTAALTNGQAAWAFDVPRPLTASVTIKNPTGQTVYSGTIPMSAGKRVFEWDGRGNNGVQLQDGNYTISVTGRDANGQNIAMASEVEGVVDSVDLASTPPQLSIGGQTFTLDTIKRVVRPRT
jgi:flagellar basal-body rod modification protein FlgD